MPTQTQMIDISHFAGVLVRYLQTTFMAQQCQRLLRACGWQYQSYSSSASAILITLMSASARLSA